MKKTADLDEIQAKLEKAQELRELIMAAKLKKKTEKAYSLLLSDVFDIVSSCSATIKSTRRN